MTDYIKREDAVFVVLQQPFFQNSMATEIRQIKGMDIVFCKECKYRKLEYVDFKEDKVPINTCEYMGNVDLDDYCSHGEREE